MTTGSVVTKIIGVYDADGGAVGEAKYLVGQVLGRLECSLCDITHGPVGRKKSFDEFRARLAVPFDVVHRNERSPIIAAATGEALPCVVGVTDSGVVAPFDRDELRACGGDGERFAEALRDAITAHGLNMDADS